MSFRSGRVLGLLSESGLYIVCFLPLLSTVSVAAFGVVFVHKSTTCRERDSLDWSLPYNVNSFGFAAVANKVA